jgi:gas vesicle protein
MKRFVLTAALPIALAVAGCNGADDQARDTETDLTEAEDTAATNGADTMERLGAAAEERAEIWQERAAPGIEPVIDENAARAEQLERHAEAAAQD